MRAVFFDLDGTLLDTLEDIAISANAALESCGHPPYPLEAYRELVGEGAKRLAEKATGENSVDVPAVLAAFKAHYSTQWKKHSAPYAGIEALLESLTCKGVHVGVLSNKPDVFVHQCVAHFFPNVPFCAVAGESEERPRKPDPSGLLELIDALHLTPQDVVFVGDTKTDMQTASRANIAPLGVSWGFREAKELWEHGAAEVFDTPKALEAYLLKQL